MNTPRLRGGRRLLAVVTVAALGSLAAASSAPADVTGTGGGAALASASLTGTASGTPVNVIVAPVEQVSAPAPPIATSPTTNSATLLAADISALAGAFVGVGAGSDSSSTSGATGSADLGPTGQVQSSSSLTNVAVTAPLSGGNELTASAVSSTCTASDSGTTGSTTIATGALMTALGVNATLDAAPAPNTSIPFNVVGTLGGSALSITGNAVLNEQTVTNAAGTASITVNAIHLTITATLTFNGSTFATETLDVVLAHSACTVTGPDVNTQLAAQFRSFSARTAGHGVQVSWRTASQIDVAGYNVYRELHGVKVRVNKHLIAAKQSGRYSFLDHARSAGARYWLQTVNLDGSRSWHGPARVAAQRLAA